MLRSEAPVYEIPDQPDLWFVTTWSLVREALLDPERFSNVLPPARRDTPPVEVLEEIEAIRAQGFPYTPALGTNDLPQHTRNRRMINRAFTPRAIAWMDILVYEVADQRWRGRSMTALTRIGHCPHGGCRVRRDNRAVPASDDGRPLGLVVRGGPARAHCRGGP